MKIAVVFDLEGEDPGSARAAAMARAVAPEVIAVGAGGAAPPDLQARVSRLGVAHAGLVCDPVLSRGGVRARAWALGALTRHLGADLVLVGVLAAEDTFALLPAALAHERSVPGVYRVHEVAPDPGDARSVVASLRLAGLLQRLRVRAPAVISLLADEAAAALPPAAAPPAVAVHGLAELGLDKAHLPRETNAGATFTPLQRKPAVLDDVATLLGRT
jgi:electron transfer flavoprotein alpha/beta subunit